MAIRTRPGNAAVAEPIIPQAVAVKAWLKERGPSIREALLHGWFERIGEQAQIELLASFVQVYPTRARELVARAGGKLPDEFVNGGR